MERARSPEEELDYSIHTCGSFCLPEVIRVYLGLVQASAGASGSSFRTANLVKIPRGY